MTRVRLPLVRLLAAAVFALLCLLIPMDAGAQAPDAPTVDKVTARDGWLLVEWSAPANVGGSEIIAYDLRYIETSASDTDKADPNKWTTQDNALTTVDGELRYALRNLTNGTEYDVQVRAVNANGDGGWSDTETGTPELSEKTRATIVAVRGDDGAVAVTWDAPTETVDPITAYDVRYILTSADESVDSNWMLEVDAWTGGRQFGITELTNGTEYDVQVRAMDSFGDGPWSDTVSGTPADFANSQTGATDALALQTDSEGKLVPLGSLRYWGNIASSGDEDWFKLEITDTQAPSAVGFWIYTLGGLDTVGELLDEDGEVIERDDFGGVLPDPDNFFIWRTLASGTYYVKVTGYGSETGDYVFRVRTFNDTTRRSNAVDLLLGGSSSAMIDPENDEDYFKLELTKQTDVILRGSGFPDLEGTLLNSGGRQIVYNDDGYLVPGAQNFLIRQSLSAGTYYLKVGSFGNG